MIRKCLCGGGMIERLAEVLNGHECKKEKKKTEGQVDRWN